MNPITVQKLVGTLRDRMKDSSKIKMLLGVAVGIALSRTAQIPTSELQDCSAEGYYNDTIGQGIEDKICQFNEKQVIDVSLSSETARSFWLSRYYNAHPRHPIPITDAETHFMGKLTGVGHLITPTTLDLCKAETVVMLMAINQIVDLYSAE